ncbi:MAG: N-acetyltransferase [Candidatus Sericytochromatia bacterium]|nr:N-acetyltransferase [Candidatus Tanganyikabacteria bacterium]
MNPPTNGHHPSRLNPLAVTVRAETPGDRVAIREVLQAAFGQPGEADLVDRIRQSGAFLPDLSLVADSGEGIVGHVLFSQVPVRVRMLYVQALALAPLGVRPDVQRRGVGAALVEAGLDRARRTRFPFVVVVGDPRYYTRFGFKPARPNLEANFDFPFEAFQVAELRSGSLKGLQGRVEYPPLFGQV